MKFIDSKFQKPFLIDESLNLQFEAVGINLAVYNLKEKCFKLADDALNHSTDNNKF